MLITWKNVSGQTHAIIFNIQFQCHNYQNIIDITEKNWKDYKTFGGNYVISKYYKKSHGNKINLILR